MRLTILFALLVATFAVPLTLEAENDKILNLPGLQSPPPFDQYAGYLTVDAKAGRKIFYWFVEAQTNPDNAPVFWWSNGGPGCSGLIGFLTENGPFRPNADGKTLSTNYADSWNSQVNMLYVEAPAGVGFSYSNNENDYTVGDSRTATDNYAAILQFMQRFPQFNQSAFYLSSESYGGHYVPTLAKTIVDGNRAGVNPKINFKGFFLGNPYTDPNENAYGSWAAYWGHSLISYPTWTALNQHCFVAPDSSCATYEAAAQLETGDVDPYALDFPICTATSLRSRNRSRPQARQLLWSLNQARKAAVDPSLPSVAHHPLAGKINREINYIRAPQPESTATALPYDPCVDNYATNYLNQPAVVSAIHANPNLGYAWSECSNVLNYNYSDMNVPMEPIYKYLIEVDPSLHMVIVSGDDDTVCASLGTQQWMYNLGLGQPIKDWTPWLDSKQQPGGAIVRWKGLSLVTVHTAGHEIPTFQPDRSLETLKNYLAGHF